MPWTTPETFTAGQTLTAASMNIISGDLDYLYNDYPRGVLLHTTSNTEVIHTTNQSTTYKDDTLTGSVTYEANRYLRFTLRIIPIVSGGSQDVLFRIARGTTPTEVIVWRIAAGQMSTTNGNLFTLTGVVAGPSTGATETFKVQFQGFANTNISSYAAAGVETYKKALTVEDAGPTA